MAEINIVIATHGNFGIELLNSAEMIIGKTDNVYNVSLEPGMSFENFTSIAQKLLDSLSGPILTLVDLFGGTPSNVMTFLSRKRSQKIIAGVNLPMFIDLYLKLSNNEVFDINKLTEGYLQIYRRSIMLTNKEGNDINI